MHRIALLSLLVAISACSKKAEPTTPTGGGGGGAAAGPAISQTMADAPTHNVPATIEVKAPCNESGYLKLNVPTGTAFTIDVTTSAGSAMVDVMDANGKSAGVSTEVTAEAAKNVASAGQDGATLVSVSETGACTGSTVTLAIK